MLIGKLAICAALALSVLGLPQPMTGAEGREEKATLMPDREQHGFRGPVKSCIEETTLPAVSYEGGSRPKIHSESSTEYDPGGRLLSTRHSQSDSSHWVTRYTYDAAGRLLKIGSGTEEQGLTETNYLYDQQGRLEKIVDSQRPDTPISFLYNEHGRKSRVVTSRPEDYQSNMATSGSPFEAAEMPPNLRGGGTATTIYDEHDRAVEVQIRNSSGEILKRASREYDEHGHVAEEKQILDNPATIVPPEMRTKLAQQSGVSPDQLMEQLREQISKFLVGQSLYSISYAYDAKGRVKQQSRRIFNKEDEIETGYNEHGDIELETTTGRRLPVEGEPDTGSAVNEFSQVQHLYRYDERGNWIEHTISFRSSPDGPFQSPTVIKRTITYY